MKKEKCPSCGSKSKKECFGTPGHAFAEPIGTDKWTSDAQGHDYRFKWNLPRVAMQRAIAEATDHMGRSPYGQREVKVD